MRFSEFDFDVVTDPAELEAARLERARRQQQSAPRGSSVPAPTETASPPAAQP